MDIFQQLALGGSGGEIPATAFLEAVWDAGDSASYDGSSQNFVNIETTPYSGAAQAALDLYRGATSGSTTDDPAFTGTPGGLSSGEYFSFDGGDHFRLQGSNTTFLNSLHKDASSWSVVMFLRTGSSAASSAFGLFGTSGNSASNVGVQIITTTGANLRLRIANGDGSYEINATTSTLSLANSTNQMVSLSYDDTTGVMIGGVNTTFETQTSLSIPSPSASAATYALEICGCGNATNLPASTDIARLYRVELFAKSLSTAQLTQRYNALKSRYSLP